MNDDKPIVAVTIGQSHYQRMFSEAAWRDLEDVATIVHHQGQMPANKDELLALLPGVEACITSWGVAQFDDEVVAAADSLGAIAHMGSSVQRYISDAVFERDIRVTSAGIALARDVAETTIGLMIVGRKRIWPLSQHVRDGGWRDSPVWDRWDSRELSRSTVGLVGASNVGRRVIEFLAPYETTILVSDPFLSRSDADHLGVEIVELDELLERSDVVSLHCPENEHTRQLLNEATLPLMKDGAVLINTARGGLIEEGALVAELETGRIFAFLDVSDPEPPLEDSPLRSLPNVVLTPHIAGCIENCNRMGELAVAEVRRFLNNQEAVYAITPDMFGRIA